MNTYTDRGFRDRTDYLKSLAKDYGVPLDRVGAIAQVLGSEEDFDALVTYLDEYSDLDY